ncbi:MAG: cytochrome c family protein [Acidobacteriota bacterium]
MRLQHSGSWIWLSITALCTLSLAVLVVAGEMSAEARTGPRSSVGVPIVAVRTGSSSAAGGSTTLPEEFSYIGSKKCRACHLKEYRAWQKSLHAQVFNLLKPGERADRKQLAGLDPNKDYTTDTVCLECHTVGFGQPSGFKSIKASKDLAGVGCEACHGPGSGYSKDGVMGLKNRNHSFEQVIAKGLVYPPDAEVCQRCHNERSPFNPSVDAKYVFEYTRDKVEKGTHQHLQLKYKHGPLPAGVMFQKQSPQ